MDIMSISPSAKMETKSLVRKLRSKSKKKLLKRQLNFNQLWYMVSKETLLKNTINLSTRNPMVTKSIIIMVTRIILIRIQNSQVHGLMINTMSLTQLLGKKRLRTQLDMLTNLLLLSKTAIINMMVRLTHISMELTIELMLGMRNNCTTQTELSGKKKPKLQLTMLTNLSQARKLK